MIKYGKPNEFVSDPGDRYKPEFRSEVLKNGEIVLKESGKVDLWQMINAEKEHCDMAYILKQLALGNYEAFNALPQYGDYSEMPNDYREVLNIMVNVESDFLRLPLDVRAKYDNDFHKWLADAGTDDWKKATWPDLFGEIEPAPAKDEKESVE